MLSQALATTSSQGKMNTPESHDASAKHKNAMPFHAVLYQLKGLERNRRSSGSSRHRATWL